MLGPQLVQVQGVGNAPRGLFVTSAAFRCGHGHGDGRKDK